MTENAAVQRRSAVPMPPPSLMKKYPWIFKNVDFLPGAEKAAEKAVNMPGAEKTAEKAVEETIEKPAEKAIDKPAEKVVEKMTDIVIDTPIYKAKVSAAKRSAHTQGLSFLEKNEYMRRAILGLPVSKTPVLKTPVLKPPVLKTPDVVTVINPPALKFVISQPESGKRIVAGSRDTNRVLNHVESLMFRFFTVTAPKNGLMERKGQIEMANAILDAIGNKNHLLTEAGVGIGKSFGYLVPVLLYHKETKEPVVIATSTIALQEQLASDAARLMPMLGMKEKVYIAKGQGNYLCSDKVHKLAMEGKEQKDAEEIAGILSELRKGHTDRKDLEMEVSEKLWKKVCIENYSRKTCPECVYANRCTYHKMREHLPIAGITICNQSLLTAHLSQMDKGWNPLLNPNTGIIVVDEAHNLENNVRLSETSTFSQKDIMKLVKNANAALGDRDYGVFDDDDLEAVEKAVSDLFTNIMEQVDEQIRDRGSESCRKGALRLRDTERFFFRDTNGAYGLIRALSEAISHIAHMYWDEESSHGRTPRGTSIGELLKLGNALKSLTANFGEYVFWIEIERRMYKFCFCPKDMASAIRSLFFDRKNITIMTSATMTGTSEGSVSDKYAYFMRSNGYPMERKGRFDPPPGRLHEPINSPFNYDAHAMIYHADDLPHPTKQHEAFIKAGTKRLKEILDISEGRALVLFTSKEDMQGVYDELISQGAGYRVLMQRPGASQSEILQQFRDDEHAVLLGTGVYWEGISIEGRTLSNVVIFRLPFSVPDPISESRERECINPLMEVKVPEMVIKLKQGVGRLIRNETDRGIISILDSRLADTSAAPYKNTVWNALPIRNRTNSLDEIREFYRTSVACEMQ